MRSKPSSFETLCDILYLLIMIALSVNLLFKDGFGNPESRIYHLAGFMVVILILGDSFRFIPRITSFFIKDSDNVELVQDKGKIISSIYFTLTLSKRKLACSSVSLKKFSSSSPPCRYFLFFIYFSSKHNIIIAHLLFPFKLLITRYGQIY